MFVISSIQKEYCGEIVIRELCGNSRAVTVNQTNYNYPINLQKVLYVKTDEVAHDHHVVYRIYFKLHNTYLAWSYFKEANRDSDYEKLLSLNSIGVMCKLEDIE